MQEVPTRLHTASSQLNDLYQDLDSFIDELADAAPFESKVRWTGRRSSLC